MPTTNFHEYSQQFAELLNTLVTIGQVSTFELQVDQRSTLRGFIKGQAIFIDGPELHFREFLDTTLLEPKTMYAYHYQNAAQQLIFRYDNAIHRPPLLQQDHKHTPDGIILTLAPTMQQVLDEILG
jgi:hypothetical protein